MASNWAKYRLEDVADIIGGGTPSSKMEECWGGNISWISPKDLSGYPYKRIQRGERSISELGLAKSSARLLPKNTVLITSRAPIGYVAIADTELATNQGFKSLVLKDGFDPDFVYYLIKQNVPLLESLSSGSTFREISGGVLKQVRLRFPPYPDQKAIAGILGTLDDKIELNRKMNETLEAMAQALFKSWFVDFDPVIDNALAADSEIPEPLQKHAAAREALGDQRKPLPADIQSLFPDRFVFTDEMGWVPEGWEPAMLGQFVTVKRGGSPRPIHDYLVDEGLPWVKISDATASGSRFIMGTKQFIKPEGLKKTVKLGKGELILSNSATPGLPKFLNLEACIHDGWLFFPKKELFGDNYLYQLFLVIREQLVSQGNGSVFTNLKTDILKNHHVVIPAIELMEKAESRLGFFHQRCLLLQEENNTLISIRDNLLPKLLSGELRIPDAEKQV